MAPTTTTKAATPKAKATGAGVKKGPGAPKGGRKANAKNAMIKMQAYCKCCILSHSVFLVKIRVQSAFSDAFPLSHSKWETIRHT